mgnify:CR=1 FL=1
MVVSLTLVWCSDRDELDQGVEMAKMTAVQAAVRVLEKICSKYGHSLTMTEGLLGGVAIHKTGGPFPDETAKLALEADAEEFQIYDRYDFTIAGGQRWSIGAYCPTNGELQDITLHLPLGPGAQRQVSALGGVWMLGEDNNIFTQIGLIVLVGLSAKNAILIVEFANQQRAAGASLIDAAMDAARLRFRPIIMTSMAFILGVVPLVVATGAGAASRNSIGTGVFGGMLTATFLAIFFVPLFFVIIGKLTSKRKDATNSTDQHLPQKPEAIEETHKATVTPEKDKD